MKPYETPTLKIREPRVPAASWQMLAPANVLHTYRMIQASMPKGTTRATIRAKRLGGACNGLQPLLKSGHVAKAASGRYVVSV